MNSGWFFPNKNYAMTFKSTSKDVNERMIFELKKRCHYANWIEWKLHIAYPSVDKEIINNKISELSKEVSRELTEREINNIIIQETDKQICKVMNIVMRHINTNSDYKYYNWKINITDDIYNINTQQHVIDIINKINNTHYTLTNISNDKLYLIKLRYILLYFQLVDNKNLIEEIHDKYEKLKLLKSNIVKMEFENKNGYIDDISITYSISSSSSYALNATDYTYISNISEIVNNSNKVNCFNDIINDILEYIKYVYILTLKNLSEFPYSLEYLNENIELSDNYLNEYEEKCQKLSEKIENRYNEYNSIINDTIELCNSIEHDKFIIIYPDANNIDKIASELNKEFKNGNIKFKNIYTEYKIYDGIYTRLSANDVCFGNNIDRYIPQILKGTFLQYIETILTREANIPINDVNEIMVKDAKVKLLSDIDGIPTQYEKYLNIEHPFKTDLQYYNFDDSNIYNYITLPKTIKDINEALPKIISNEVRKKYNIDY